MHMHCRPAYISAASYIVVDVVCFGSNVPDLYAASSFHRVKFTSNKVHLDIKMSCVVVNYLVIKCSLEYYSPRTPIR